MKRLTSEFEFDAMDILLSEPFRTMLAKSSTDIAESILSMGLGAGSKKRRKSSTSLQSNYHTFFCKGISILCLSFPEFTNTRSPHALDVVRIHVMACLPSHIVFILIR